MQASECAGERTTLALKPMGRVTQSPKRGNQWYHKMDLGPTKFFKNSEIQNKRINLGIKVEVANTKLSLTFIVRA